MYDRRQALNNLIDKAQSDALRAEARGQFKAAAKHWDKSGRLLAELDNFRV